ncbi:PKD domain-containing protein [Massilia atriviolacea]|nr:PKD domain-containing protein [Massilia atriviolacea]
MYRIVHLSPSANGPLDINARGQVAFTEDVGGDRTMARYYDGTSFTKLGTLGGAGSHVNALNDAGQIVGGSNFSPASTDTHAYRWSAQTGMLTLHTPPYNFATSAAFDINNSGQVAGYLPFFGPVLEPLHATRWSAENLARDLGTLNGPSLAIALNESGQVAGSTRNAAGNGLAFRWTEAGGMLGLGTLGGADSDAVAINRGGHVAGHSATAAGLTHAFLWTPEKGMTDLGPRRADADAFAIAMNDRDTVIGIIRIVDGPYRAFVWTGQTGMRELGTFGGRNAYAHDINQPGQVVGSAEARDGASRAFLWQGVGGLVDLNSRIPLAPPGLVLTAARAIADNGAIVADSNAGLVLLVPNPATHVAPTVGPIETGGVARVNQALAVSASVRDPDPGDTHRAIWSWGDGSKDEAGVVAEKNGAATVGGQHTYRAAGIYTVRLTVTDSSGQSATVQRIVVVCGPGAYLSGEGSFISPPGAIRVGKRQSGRASFAFLSERQSDGRRAQGAAFLRFSTAHLSFDSKRVDAVTVNGARIAYRGGGTLNGAGNVQFALMAAARPDGRHRLHIRIWHVDPATNRELVDYDSQAILAGAGAVRIGLAE